jgi:ATP-binding cassette, subfamily B, bacterial HlyB/CyaB
VPEGGRILIDGIDIGTVDVSWLRRQVGVMLQENVLFNRSIRDNNALIDPGLPLERIIASATLALQLQFCFDMSLSRGGLMSSSPV